MKKGKDGRYRTKVVVGAGPDGKPIVKWATGKTQAEVKERIDQIKTVYRATNGETTRVKSTVLGAYAQDWYRIYKKGVVKPKTELMYRAALNAHILPAFGSRIMSTIKPIEIQAWVNGYKGARGGTVDAVLLTLRQLFGRALIDGVILRDPCAGLIRPKTIRVERKPVSDEHVAKLLEVGATHKEGLILPLLYYTGMRRGEALGLKWEDVDYEKGLIHVHREVVYAGGNIEVYEADENGDGLKTAAAERYIPISAPLMAVLKARRGLDFMPVFSAPESGGWLSENTYRRRWKRLMEAAELTDEHITAHRLRHTYSSVIRRAGLDIKERQYIMGHADPEITNKTYTHIQEQDIPVILSKLDAVFR